LVQKPEGKRPAEDLGIDRRVLKWILRILWYDMKWSQMAQNRDQRDALLNMVKTSELPVRFGKIN